MREWEGQRTDMLQTEHNKSLAAAIELSLTSLMFQELGPSAQELLGVVAFFPQGVDENNLDWLFPQISNRTHIFDKFCILSLAYRSNGFITMLAPLRDYLSPKDPKSSPLLCKAKEHYFSRLSVDVDPTKPGFMDAQWIISEDVNVEHLLDIFISIDMNLDSLWDACIKFMVHLYWHKRRLISLGPKIEGLPDDHYFKPDCLLRLSLLSQSIGNQVERKQLLSHTLRLRRERKDYSEVAATLRNLSDANCQLGLYKEGIQMAKEALKTCEWLRDIPGQALCLFHVAASLQQDQQLDAAEGAASHAINLFSEQGNQFEVCQSQIILGNIYYSKGDLEKAIYHFRAVLGIASNFNWHDPLFQAHYYLAHLFFTGDKFNNAHTHIEQAKSYAVNSTFSLGLVMHLQAQILCHQGQLKEARSEALHAIEIFERLGAVQELAGCRELIQQIEQQTENPIA